MQNNTNAAISLILQWEGPEVNISNTEPGGISKYGVSLQTYADYCKKNNLPTPTANTIADMTANQAADFYTNAFLPTIRFNDLPNGVDIRLADISINLGITGACELLQMVLLQKPPLTDQITNNHITLCNNWSPAPVILALSAGWISKKHDANTWPTFGLGWTNRNIAVTEQCLNLGGV